jgi:hypothetical protein
MLSAHERWNNKFYYKVASCWLFLLNIYTVNGQVKAVNRYCSVSTMIMKIERPEFDSPQKQTIVIAMNESLNSSLGFYFFIFRICAFVTTVGNVSAEIQLYLKFNLR